MSALMYYDSYTLKLGSQIQAWLASVQFYNGCLRPSPGLQKHGTIQRTGSTSRFSIFRKVLYSFQFQFVLRPTSGIMELT